MATPNGLQFCSPADNDDEDDETEVFFGEISSRELRKASKYNHRRTAAYTADFRRDLYPKAGSCGSGSPLESSCGSQSPLDGYDQVHESQGISLDQWMAALSFSPDPGSPEEGAASGGFGYLYLDSPLSGAAENITGDKQCIEQIQDVVVSPEDKDHDCSQITDDDSPISLRLVPQTPSTPCSLPSQTNTPLGLSPLVNTAGLVATSGSPQTIYGDLASICDNITYTDIFSANHSQGLLSRFSANHVEGQDISTNQSSEPQEVPELPPSGWYHTAAEDLSIVTVGSAVDESILDASPRTYQYDTQSHLYNSQSHQYDSPCHQQVPEVPSPALNGLPSGLLFKENQFSPTLAVHVSPPRETEPRQKLFLDLSPLRHSGSQDSLAPESPECLSEVKFTLTRDPTTPSPKKSRVKRLPPCRSPKANDSARNTRSVFDRLYGLRKTPGSEQPAEKPRAHSASKLPTHTTPSHGKSPASKPSTPNSAKRGLSFPRSAESRPHSSPAIRTTGTVNRQAVCQATKPSPGARSKPSPGNRHSKPSIAPRHNKASRQRMPNAAKSPSMPPVFRKGTPRHLPRSRLNGDEPPPVLDLEDCGTDHIDNHGDHTDNHDDALSALDSSILLQEKRVELERLQEVKARLQQRTNTSKKASPGAKIGTAGKRITGASPRVTGVSPRVAGASPRVTASPRSPLVPTTAHNLPRVRYNDRQSLALSEPELDAITLVHTLCNSQQVAKLVSKQRAANVARHTAHAVKPASKLQWRENITSDEPEVFDESMMEETGKRRSILTIRQPNYHFPYSEEPASPIVVTKGNRKFSGFCKDPKNVHLV